MYNISQKVEDICNDIKDKIFNGEFEPHISSSYGLSIDKP